MNSLLVADLLSFLSGHMRLSLLVLFMCCFTPYVGAQSFMPDDLGEQFRFVRVKYDSNASNSSSGSGRYGRRWNRRDAWATDWPTADDNLHQAISRTTELKLSGSPLVLTLKDENIFQYPVLYITEPGYWHIYDDEVENLRKYLDRGGFLIVDDFHDYGRDLKGPQWENFYQNIKKVYPDKEPVELSQDHPIWSIFYDIDPLSALSTKGYMNWDDDVYYAIHDDTGRITVVICYNQDIGDGWEWPGRNLGEASTVSFQMAINFIMYALSH